MCTAHPQPLATAQIHQDGIVLNGRRYNHPALAAHIGESISLFKP